MDMNKKGQTGLVVFIVVMAFAFIGLIILATGYDTVETGKYGVLTQFGDPIGSMGPGMKWTGIFTDVTEFDLRTRGTELVIDTPALAMSDKAMQDLYGTVQLNYVLNKNKIMSLFNDVVRNDEEVEKKLLLKQIMMKEFKDVAATYTADEWLLSRADITERTCNAIRNQFVDSYIIIQSCVVSNTDVNSAYRAQIELQKVKEKEKITAEKQFETQKILNNIEMQTAAKNANVTVINAKAENAKKIIEAEAAAKQIELLASADASKIRMLGEAEGAALRAKKTETNQLLVDMAWIDAWKAGAKVPTWVTSDSSGSFLMNIAGPEQN